MPKVKEYRPNAALMANIVKFMSIQKVGFADLARGMGCAQSTIYKKINENRLGDLRLNELRAIAKVLGVKVEELFD